MRQMLEITPLTLKRLRNYGQVVENSTKLAHKKQWMTMTLESMQEYQRVLKTSDHAAAVVGYASFLFRVQQGMAAPRALYGEQVLANSLVKLLTELQVPIVMIEVPEEEPEVLNI